MVNDNTPRAGRRGSASEIWLAFETSTRLGSVGLWRDGLAFEETLGIQGAHSEVILPAIQRALELTDTSRDDIEAIVVGSGPGSFTGVRIAASLAKGWVMARGTPLYAYSSLLAVAAGCGREGPICPLFDARRGEVYAACYAFEDGVPASLLAPAAWRLKDLLAELKQRKIKPAFVGEGAGAYREVIESEGGTTILPAQLGVPRAASLLWLRSAVPDLGEVEKPADWEPIYVRAWRVAAERGRS